MDQSDTQSAGIFSRRTNQTHEAQVYSQTEVGSLTLNLAGWLKEEGTLVGLLVHPLQRLLKLHWAGRCATQSAPL
eukprot:5002003-Pyramimonas_sp.AAC.2